MSNLKTDQPNRPLPARKPTAGTFCPNCSDKGIFSRNKDGYTVCRNCGYVLSTCYIDESEDARTFQTAHGQTAQIRGGTYGELGITFAFTEGAKSQQLRRTMQLVNSDPLNDKIKKFNKAIQEKCSELGENARIVYERAQAIFKESQTNLLQKPRSKVQSEAAAAGSIYYACIENGKGLEQETVCKVFPKLTTRQLSAAVEWLKPLSTATQNVEDIARRQARNLNLSERVVDVIFKVGAQVRENSLLSSSKPSTVAGAIIYHVISQIESTTDPHFKVKADEIAKVLGVSASTIIKSSKELGSITPYMKHLPEYETMQQEAAKHS